MNYRPNETMFVEREDNNQVSVENDFDVHF